MQEDHTEPHANAPANDLVPSAPPAASSELPPTTAQALRPALWLQLGLAVLVGAWLAAIAPVYLAVPWLIFFGLNTALAARVDVAGPGGWLVPGMFGAGWAFATVLATAFSEVGGTLLGVSTQALALCGYTALLLTAAVVLSPCPRAATNFVGMALAVTAAATALLTQPASPLLATLVTLPPVFATLWLLQRRQHPLPASGSATAEDADDEVPALREVAVGDEPLARLQHELAELRSEAAIDAAIVQSGTDGMLAMDGIGRVTRMNPVAEVLTGWKQSDAIGRDFVDILQLVGEDNRPLRSPDIADCLVQQRPAVSPARGCKLIRKDGLQYPVEFSAAPLRGETTGGLAISFRDVTERFRETAQTLWRASHDDLTGLPNRDEFERRLTNHLENDGPEMHVLLHVDLDNAAMLLERFGERAFDEYLKTVADALKLRVRGADTLARVGNDEFAVLLTSCPLAKGRMIAEGLRSVISDQYTNADGLELRATASIGMVPIDTTECSISELLRAADAACLRAKRNGRNCIAVVAARADANLLSHPLTQFDTLQRALNTDRLSLDIQTIRPLKQDGESSCELFLRIPTDNGNLTPKDFLSSAERYHLLPKLDRWVCQTVVDAIDLGHPVLAGMDRVNINLGTQSVYDPHFQTFLERLLDTHSWVAPRLGLELNEQVLAGPMERLERFIAGLRHRGCEITLDHCGRGMTAFNELGSGRFDCLKLDQALVAELNDHSVNFEVLLAITRIAHGLKLKTVATGVTEAFQLDLLSRVGIDYCQGYLIGRPRALSARAQPQLES